MTEYLILLFLHSLIPSFKHFLYRKTRVFEKLNIKNPAQVARFLMEHDLMQGVYE